MCDPEPSHSRISFVDPRDAEVSPAGPYNSTLDITVEKHPPISSLGPGCFASGRAIRETSNPDKEVCCNGASVCARNVSIIARGHYIVQAQTPLRAGYPDCEYGPGCLVCYVLTLLIGLLLNHGEPTQRSVALGVVLRCNAELQHSRSHVWANKQSISSHVSSITAILKSPARLVSHERKLSSLIAQRW